MVFSPRVLVVNQQKNVDYESDNVKDKKNLLSYIAWSCGDYSNDPSSLIARSGVTKEFSTNWSSMGSYSIKLTGSSWDWVGYQIYDLSNIPSSFQVSADINTSIMAKFNCDITYSDSSSDSYSVDITKPSTPIITVIPDSTKIINLVQIRLTLMGNGIAYMDNINLKTT